ncbi:MULTISPECIES: cryptochrome/photolyase family protein [unclassified Acinetobacter]|uniref:cryptochrome/photolyase family protein n=1 Tax=unclassified Acinetobacter TaxID=196816 RepID=UPI0035B6D47E
MSAFTVSIIFPHQLFADVTLWQDECILIEERLLFRQYPFHQSKICFHRASMQAYRDKLLRAGKTVHYIDSLSPYQRVSDLIFSIQQVIAQPVQQIHIVDVMDDWLGKSIQKAN